MSRFKLNKYNHKHSNGTGYITRSGHTMFQQDIVAELHRLENLEKWNAKLKAELDQYRWRDTVAELPNKETKTEIVGKHIWCLVQCSNKGIIARPFNSHHQCWDDEDMDDHYTDAVTGSITHWQPLPSFDVEKQLSLKAVDR